MELLFDLWHLAFVNLIQRRAPPSFEVQSEVRLTIEPQRAEAERDEYLRLFSRRPARQGEATQWLRQWLRDTKMKQPEIDELPSFEELFEKTIKKTVAAMPLEERLEGLAPEQLIPALPLEALRALSEEYLRSLPAEIQEQVRKRLQGEAH